MSRLYRLYGTTTESTFHFTSNVPTASGPPTLRVEEASPASSNAYWGDLTSVCSSVGTEDPVPSTVYRHDEEDLHVLCFHDAADFVFTPETISYHLHDPNLEHAIEIWLLGTVFSMWNELRVCPALHTAAVAIDDAAIGFLATNKGGKSTLAAAFMQAGYPLLTDDILMIESSASGVVGQPSYPQMRMWPDQARHFVGNAEALPQVVPHLSKRRVPVGPDGFGTFEAQARPVTHLFLPERRSDTSSVEISRLSPQEALMEILRHSFLPNTVESLGLAPRRLPVLTALLEQASVFRLVYPDGVEHLPRVTDELLEVVSNGQ